MRTLRHAISVVTVFLIVAMGAALAPAYALGEGGGISAQEAALPASGVSGTCTWSVDAAGNLVVAPASGAEGTLADWEVGEDYRDWQAPWSEVAGAITSVRFSGTVRALTCFNMFDGCTALRTADLSGLDTSQVSDMAFLFRDCSSLASLDLSGLDTSHVESMTGMFWNCSSLASIDLSGVDTSKVQSMIWMFDGCSSLTALDVSGFDTSQVVMMDCMFRNCSALTELNLSGFDTSNVEHQSDMFSGCSSLTSIDIAHFELRQQTSLNFSGCTSLKWANVSETIGSKGTTHNVYLNDCASLRGFSVGSWTQLRLPDDTYNINIYDTEPPQPTTKWYSLRENAWFTANEIVGVSYRPSPASTYDGGYTWIPLPGAQWRRVDSSGRQYMRDTYVRNPNAIDMTLASTSIPTQVYTGSAIEPSPRVQLSGCADLVRGTDYELTFVNNVELGIAQAVFTGKGRFTGEKRVNFRIVSAQSGLSGTCTWRLEDGGKFVIAPTDGVSGELGSWGGMNSPWKDYFPQMTSVSIEGSVHAKTCEWMFVNCPKLTRIDLTGLDTSGVTNFGWMFLGCTFVERMDLSMLDTSAAADMRSMFGACSSVRELVLGERVTKLDELPSSLVDGHADWYSAAEQAWLSSSDITARRLGVADTYTKYVPQAQEVFVPKPEARDFTYDGVQHVGVAEGVGYELSGDTSASEVGTYRVVATLLDGYAWEDGTQARSVELSWKIEPAGGEPGPGPDPDPDPDPDPGSGDGPDPDPDPGVDPDPRPDPGTDPDPQPAPGPGDDDPAPAVNMLRLYNPNSGEHFYTADGEERDGLVALGWKFEGVGWAAPAQGVPVYRLYNPNAGDHHYTTDAGEKDALVELGWAYEGVGWSSAGEGGVPLLRLYNPNATGAGAHHYTTDEEECDGLVALGWKFEGIGWYGR